MKADQLKVAAACMPSPKAVSNPALSAEERRSIEEVVELCRTARKRLGTHGTFRLRVLLDMLLLELGKERARAAESPSGALRSPRS